MKMKDKEKLVKDLVNTFNDRDDLHEAYKGKMKEIIYHAIDCFLHDLPNIENNEKLTEWVHTFVEERFKPQ